MWSGLYRSTRDPSSSWDSPLPVSELLPRSLMPIMLNIFISALFRESEMPPYLLPPVHGI